MNSKRQHKFLVSGIVNRPHLTDGRLLLALDDYINPKTGQKIYACDKLFDHAAKLNQTKYPWAQNVVAVGLLKIIKGRWACLPLNWRSYHMEKSIERIPLCQYELDRLIKKI